MQRGSFLKASSARLPSYPPRARRAASHTSPSPLASPTPPSRMTAETALAGAAPGLASPAIRDREPPDWLRAQKLTPARARELLGRGGILQLPPAVEGGAREPTLPSVLLRMLGLGTDPATKERARGLVAEIDGRQDRAVTALRSDVVNADILAWANGAPVELNLQRGPRGNSPGNTPWIINLYTKFAKDSDVWLRVEHLPVKSIRLDAWLTDPTVFTRARDSRAEFFAEVSEFGLQLEHFAIFNQARDTFQDPAVPQSTGRRGDRVDSLV